MRSVCQGVWMCGQPTQSINHQRMYAPLYSASSPFSSRRKVMLLAAMDAASTLPRETFLKPVSVSCVECWVIDLRAQG